MQKTKDGNQEDGVYSGRREEIQLGEREKGSFDLFELISTRQLTAAMRTMAAAAAMAMRAARHPSRHKHRS